MKTAIRSLLRTPGLSLMAVLTLALGIGANSAMFTIVDCVLLRPLPYPDAHRILHVGRGYRDGEFGLSLSGQKFRAWLDGLAAAESSVAYTLGSANIATAGYPKQVMRVYSTWQLFDVYGAKPVIGRFFAKEDETGFPVVVLSYEIWQRRFGGDTGVVGQSMLEEGAPATIIGVAPAGFNLGWEADLFRPFSIEGGPQDTGHQYTVALRLKPGIRLEQLHDELQIRERGFRRTFPDAMKESEIVATQSLSQVRTGNVQTALLLLFGAAGLVLLIACANVANLLLARSWARSREFSIRVALGATRLRIVGQLLTEGLVLSLTAGGAALLVAAWMLDWLLKLVAQTLPRASEVSLDWRVIAATLGLSVMTTLIFALAPAWGASRLALADSLRDSRGTSVGRARRRLRNGIVMAEIGLCTVLLICSALAIRTFLNLRAVSPGFDPAPLLTFAMSMAEDVARDAKVREATYRQIANRIETIPGIEAAAAMTEFPLNGGPDFPAEIEGRLGEESPIVSWRAVTSHVFQAVGIPLQRGRAYNDWDSADGAPVAIVNEAFVRAFRIDDDPIGKRIVIGRTLGSKWADVPRTIVGVVGDVKTYALHAPARPTVYLPVSQVPYIITPGSWVVRVRGNIAGLPKLIQREVVAIDPLLPASRFRAMEEMIDRGISQLRFNMFLFSLFGFLALALAIVGVYGVTSYSVTQRTQEIGIRMALGADASNALRMVLRESLLLGAAGVALGIAASFAVTRLLSGLLYGVSPNDAATFVLTAVGLLLVTLLAAAIPAVRAARIDPLVALRYE